MEENNEQKGNENENIQNVNEQNSQDTQNAQETTNMQEAQNVQEEANSQQAQNVQETTNSQETQSTQENTNSQNVSNENQAQIQNNQEGANNTSNAQNNYAQNTNYIKNEANATINQVKETVKNVNFKKDSEMAKGFFSSFFKNPIEEIKKVGSDGKGNFLKIAIIVFVVWIFAILIGQVISIASRYLFGTFGSFDYFFRHLFSNIFDLVKNIIAPVISVALLSGLIYAFTKNKNKSFLSVVNGVVIAKIPVVASSVISLLSVVVSGLSKITSYFSSFCTILSTVLLYFVIKHLSNETDNENYFWKFALIMGIFIVVEFVASYLGIYLN